ncbi:tetratricopeptide repeat protein [Halomonas sp. H5]|uniref:tetratricopeptide repeat protein n=1 Tax=Halomonas sp. H5 TaxID=3423910 RepID=UPI003D36FCF0
MRKCHALSALTLGLSLTLSPPAIAQQQEAAELRQQWERITTQPGEQRDALAALAERAETLVGQYPEAAELLTWQGIILASEARERGGLGALNRARGAREALERAIELDPQGLNGSAYVTLGALYDRVPGGLIGFGDDDTAEAMFQRALAIRPQGIDVNFYYAEFLAESGQAAQAREHARRALEGEARTERQASDEALRTQARALLRRLEG